MYDCTQIRVNYKLPENTTNEDGLSGEGRVGGGAEDDEDVRPRYERALIDNDYPEDFGELIQNENLGLPKPFPTGIQIIR